MKPKTLQFIFNLSILAMAICCGVWLYNFFGPNLPKVENTSLAIEGFFSIIVIVLAITKKKWDKQESDKKQGE